MDRRRVAERAQPRVERSDERLVAVAGRVDRGEPDQLLEQRDELVGEVIDSFEDHAAEA